MFERTLVGENVCRLTQQPIVVPMFQALCSAPIADIASMIRGFQYEIVRRGIYADRKMD
jgi:hypothetical protein